MRVLCLIALTAACSGASGAGTTTGTGSPAGRRPPPPTRKPVTIAVIGTSDLHGHISMLPFLAGHLANLSAAGKVDATLLLDGGDMFQGTLESNLNEGESVVEAYNRLGYAAVAVGNHEFDFGPAGEHAVPRDPSDDPRGALKARSAQASFPFLAANLRDAATGQQVAWPNLHPSVIVERAGVKIGIIGGTTEDTPRTTTARNFAGLAVAPLAETIRTEAAALRGRGAHIIVVTVHAGGRCKDLDDPTALGSCVADAEIFEVARALPAGAVDVIVAGHTHAGVAHHVNGIAIIQSFTKGIAFGRVDVVLDPDRKVLERRIHPPRYLCGVRREPPNVDAGEPCASEEYEGRPVEADGELAALAARYRDAARAVRDQKLGVPVEREVRRSYGEESALGNLFADLMRAAHPRAEVAITNGGGLRADLPVGPLTYGALYEAMPFDNRFAVIQLSGGQLARMIAGNLTRDSGIFSISGVRAEARCDGAKLEVVLTRLVPGKRGARAVRVRDGDRLTLVTSDFLASGGDGMLSSLELGPDAVKLEDDGPTIRDALAEELRKRKAPLRGDDHAIHDPKAPRVSYPGRRPVRCE